MTLGSGGHRCSVEVLSATAVLSALPGFRGAREIHAALRGAGERIGIATVYRQLRFLAGQGSVDTIHGGNGETLRMRWRAGQPDGRYGPTCGVNWFRS